MFQAFVVGLVVLTEGCHSKQQIITSQTKEVNLHLEVGASEKDVLDEIAGEGYSRLPVQHFPSDGGGGVTVHLRRVDSEKDDLLIIEWVASPTGDRLRRYARVYRASSAPGMSYERLQRILEQQERQ